MKKIITYQSDGFFFPLASLKFFNVAKAMLKSTPSTSGLQSAIVHLAKRKNKLVISGTLLIASSLAAKLQYIQEILKH